MFQHKLAGPRGLWKSRTSWVQWLNSMLNRSVSGLEASKRTRSCRRHL